MKNPKDIIVSAATKEKAASAKLYIQRRYTKLIQSQMEKKLNWQKLYEKMNALSLAEHEKQQIKETILHKETQALREARQKDSISDFDFVKVIGKGAFGEVRLYKWHKNNQPVAIKRMVKSEMIYKNKILQAQVEQNLMAKLSLMSLNKHVVKLLSSFQDDKYLYLVMEYLGGGDMMNLLIKKDIFTEDEARFYIAELVLSIECIHKLKYIHRDLKPDNILLDASGHLKLSDFGLCKHTEIKSSSPKPLLQTLKVDDKPKNGCGTGALCKRKLAYSTVGTPDYVAPEVQSKNGYTETVDWWSLGVILFEMLAGYPPFCSQNSQKTWQNIQNWRKVLKIPKDKQLSPQAIDLIKKLINDEKYRLGTNGVEQIKAHPFFAGVNWKTIKDSVAPNIPQLSDGFDTRHFDEYQSGEEWVQQKSATRGSKRENYFVGYTFKQNPKENSELLKALVDLDALIPTKNKNASRQNSLKDAKYQSLEKEKEKQKEKEKEKPFNKKAFTKMALATNKGLVLNSTNIRPPSSKTSAHKLKAELVSEKKQKPITVVNKSQNLRKKL